MSDDGPGLPAEQVEQIFAPFHCAPDAADVPGVGLGLTIVKQIAERHGGTFTWIPHRESEPPSWCACRSPADSGPSRINDDPPRRCLIP